MDYIFFQMTAINGFDGLSHYLRAGLIVNLCSAYAITPTPGCNANFTGTRAITAGAASAGKRDPYLENTRRVLAGKEALPAEQAEPVKDDGKADGGGSTKPGGTIFKGLLGVDDPELKAQRQAAIKRVRDSANRGHSEQLDGLGGAAGADPRVPAGGRPMRRRAPGTPSVLGSPVLIGALTRSITIVAVFLSYNANSGLPFVPSYDLKAAAAQRGQPRGGQRRAGGRHAGGRGRRDRGACARTARRRFALVELKLDKDARPAAEGLHVRRAAALGARTQVRGDHARALDKGYQAGATIPLSAASPSRWRSTRSSTCSTSAHARRLPAVSLRGLRRRLAGRGRTLNTRSSELARS